ncbi:hypothetical protein [Tateyamaria sp. syn59]|uniref:hypothetical protein n=1 Tax=Tateyamaria sp. syn59 TaxID=2576942 RepID=UPI0011BE6053|nr:hypothetical protein [Tateyamaria sp. syn59]
MKLFTKRQKKRQFCDIVDDLLNNTLIVEVSLFFLGRKVMLRTIALGSAVLIQGFYVKTLPDGRMTVRVDGANYSGTPVSQTA